MQEGYRGSLLAFYREYFAGEPDVLSVDEAAAMVKVTRDTVLKWCAEGNLEVFTVIYTYANAFRLLTAILSEF